MAELVEAVPATDAGFSYQDVPNAFYGDAMSALLEINDVIEPGDYLDQPRLAARMRALTGELHSSPRVGAR